MVRMTNPSSTPSMPPEAAAAQHVIQIATGFIVSTALQVAVRLGIPDRLAKGPKSAAELAAEAGVQEDPLYRVLRALASVGIFEESDGRRFALTLAGGLLRSGVPGSMQAMAMFMSSPFHLRVYSELMHSLKTGRPAVEKAMGMPVFEYFPKDPELSEIFNNAMTSFSDIVIPAALSAYDFGGIDTLVDVAGGHGAVLTAILKKNPGMKGILFDLDHVIAGARGRIEASGVADRLTTQSGDFFKAVPAGDGYVMKHIIHDWDDDRASTILRNIRSAMGSGRGRVVLLESVIQPGNAPDFGKIVDIEMLAMPGGKERTEAEFRALFEKSGFRLSRIVPTQSPLSVIEAVPA
jgi:hypothetical protein